MKELLATYLGVPIAIFGIGFGAARGTSTVTINGTEVASYLIWGEHNAMLDMIVVQPDPNATAGPVVVNMGGHNSNATQVFAPTTGSVYAVAPAGSDTNPCSLLQPCATILHADTEVMHAGDALLVHGGSLNDDEIGFKFIGGKSIGVGDVDNHSNRVINNSFEGAIGYDAIGTHGNNHMPH